MLWHDFSPPVDAGPHGLARQQPGEALGQVESAQPASVQGGCSVENLPGRLRQWFKDGEDQLDVKFALQPIASVGEVLNLGGLVQVGQPGNNG